MRIALSQVADPIALELKAIDGQWQNGFLFVRLRVRRYHEGVRFPPAVRETLSVCRVLEVRGCVVDLAIQVQDSRWVLIYLAIHKRLAPYEKAHARSLWKDLAATKTRPIADAPSTHRVARAWRNHHCNIEAQPKPTAGASAETPNATTVFEYSVAKHIWGAEFATGSSALTVARAVVLRRREAHIAVGDKGARRSSLIATIDGSRIFSRNHLVKFCNSLFLLI